MPKKGIYGFTEIRNYGGLPPYDAVAVMKLLGVRTLQELKTLQNNGKLLGLPGDGWIPPIDCRESVYPRWQFGANGKLLPGLDEILIAAPRSDPWGVADILTSPQKIFNDRSPIEMLVDGKEPDVVSKTIQLIRRAYDD